MCQTAPFQVPEEAFRVFNRSGLLFQVRTARRSAPYLVPAFSTSLPAPPLPSPPGAEHMHTGKERCSRWPGLRWRQAVRSGAASAVLRRPRLPGGRLLPPSGRCSPMARPWQPGPPDPSLRAGRRQRAHPPHNTPGKRGE